MNKYRFLSTAVWSDDTFVKMSPEQKLIYIYLNTSPYTSMCGIFKLSVATMGHFLGLRNDTIENAFRGFLLSFPDWVKYDKETGETAIIYWPKFALVNANVKAMKKAERELEEVESIKLLQAVIKANSATLSKMYLHRLRQLQMEAINNEKMASLTETPYQSGDVSKVVENEPVKLQKEKEIEIENIYVELALDQQDENSPLLFDEVEPQKETPITPKIHSAKIPPDIQRLRKRLNCKNAKHEDAVIQIVDYFNQTAGKKSRYYTAGTLKLITYWLNQGYALEDFKKVIDFKTWYFKEKGFSDNISLDTYCRQDKFENNLEKANERIQAKEKEKAASKVARPNPSQPAMPVGYRLPVRKNVYNPSQFTPEEEADFIKSLGKKSGLF